MIDYEPRSWRSHFFDVRGTMLREILYRVMFCAVAAVVTVVLRRLGHTPHLPDAPHLFVGPPSRCCSSSAPTPRTIATGRVESCGDRS